MKAALPVVQSRGEQSRNSTEGLASQAFPLQDLDPQQYWQSNDFRIFLQYIYHQNQLKSRRGPFMNLTFTSPYLGPLNHSRTYHFKNFPPTLKLSGFRAPQPHPPYGLMGVKLDGSFPVTRICPRKSHSLKITTQP